MITATQMMESMIHSPQPTRAEVSDVANAVLDGTDAVMLSAETAVGDFPAETVQAMDRIILGAERTWQERRTDRPINDSADNIDEVIAMAAMQAANRLSNVAAIIAMTETGNTPRLMSRLRSGMPIYAFTPYPSSQRRVAILRGVHAIPFDSHALASDTVNRQAVSMLEAMGVVQTRRPDTDHQGQLRRRSRWHQYTENRGSGRQYSIRGRLCKINHTGLIGCPPRTPRPARGLTPDARRKTCAPAGFPVRHLASRLQRSNNIPTPFPYAKRRQ